MEKEMTPRSFGTHSGSFHADEVTACAFLLLFDLIDQDKITRSRDLDLLKHCEYVCDVGGVYDPSLKRFDHHQLDYNGNLSSAGMILKYLKDQKIITQKLFQYYNRSLVIGVDAIDNGKATTMLGHCSFSALIANIVPVRHDADDAEMEKAFHQALDFTLGHLKRLLEKFNYIQECRTVIQKEMKKKQKILVFEESMPWVESFFELGGEKHPAVFVIMPTGKHWKLRGIPPSLDRRMKVRVQLPREWAGLIDQQLQEKSGIKGAIFCHKGRFISIWEKREDAFKALNYVLGEKK